MQNRQTYQQNSLKHFAGLLLAILFLSIPLVQTLHSHHASESFIQPSAEKSFSSAADKCLICDYTANLKGKQILMAHPPVLSVPNDVCVTLNTFVYTRIYKFTLQNFSNKGPPSHLS